MQGMASIKRQFLTHSGDREAQSFTSLVSQINWYPFFQIVMFARPRPTSVFPGVCHRETLFHLPHREGN